MNLIEQLRADSLEHIHSVRSFSKDWPQRLKKVQPKLSGAKRPQDIIHIGDGLSALFSCVSADRSQGGVSVGGTVWECLLVWYLNLCLEGTCAYCVKGKKRTPQSVTDAFTIKHDNTTLRSEPDVLIISSAKLASESARSSLGEARSALDNIISGDFGSTGVINIQCKTNWNDNAQIPMLWNMLYSQARKGALIENGFTIGTSGQSLANLVHFGYAFATVPTQKDLGKFKPQSTPVLRAKTMSAGNYWGHPSKNGVCQSISKIFDVFSKNTKVYPNVSEVGKAALENSKD